MKKFLPAYAARCIVLILMMYSCGSSGANTPETTIVGTWKLKQEYYNEGEDTPLKEFLLSTCDKATTLEIYENGKFIEKSYYENSSIGGGCAKDTEETKGFWKNNPEEVGFCFIYDKSNILVLKESKVTIKNGDLVNIIVYNDKDLGPETILKFVYSRV